MARTHCKHGHEFTPSTTIARGNGERTCRVCFNRRQAEYRKRKADGGLYRIDRLLIAGRAAPKLRRGVGAERIVHIVGRDGRVKRRAALRDVQDALVKRAGIELDTLFTKRPASVVCRNCGRSVRVKPRGAIPSVCVDGCVTSCSCGSAVPTASARRAAKRGLAPTCAACSSRKNVKNMKRPRTLSEAQSAEMLAAHRAGAHTKRYLAKLFGVSIRVVDGVVGTAARSEAAADAWKRRKTKQKAA